MVLGILDTDTNGTRMLTSATSSAQYLHPDYLQPLPTTLDAKKSPLALLAQTCSNIGKDLTSTTASKTMISTLDTKKEGRSSADKNDERPMKREAETKSIPVSARSSPPKSPRKSTPEHDQKSTSPHQERTSPVRLSPVRASSPVLPSRSLSTEPKSEPRQSPKSTPVSLPTTSSSSVTSSSITGHLSIDPHLYYSHAAALDPLYASALAAHGLGLKPGELPPHLGSTVSPYVAYAQVKTANGSTTLVPVCRDPYCTNCQLSLRGASLQSSTCPAGCTQCNHDKSPSTTSTPTPAPLAHHHLPFLPFGLAPGLGSLYPSYLTSAHGLPYVCNWVSASEHCGKRFSTSEDLLRHLHTHTNSTEASSLPLGTYPSLSPYHGHLPSSLSPTSLHRYPTSLSPISSSLSSSSRFHPYKSSLSSLSSASLSGLPPSIPSLQLPAYYSPYSLYGQRLGATVTP